MERSTAGSRLKHQLHQQLSQAIAKLRDELALDLDLVPEVQLTRSRDPRHGDFACNIALMLAKPARRNPREVAQLILDALPESLAVAKAEIAGPGFINFFLRADAIHGVVKDILNQGESFGLSDIGAGKKVQVEFVSANPTGPLHVGHGRGAAYGATVANLLEAVGFEVQREYYVNDAGRQMDILATSVWLRYLELCGETISFPANGYRGDYVWDIAASLHRDHGDAYRQSAAAVFADIPPDAPQDEDAPTDLPMDGPNKGDKEAHIDGLIARAKALLNDNRYRFVFELALNTLLDDIRDDLEKFGVVYDRWFSERSLAEKGAINRAIERLRKSDHLYEQDGALWFRSTDFGDEKNRVVERENGQTTYFASDIAYHMDKLEREFDRVIDVWGADHHGYIPRVKAALAALGDNPDKLDVLLVQFANLYRGGQKVQMSTRSGEFVSLRQLRKEVGKDAARFFYVMRRCEQHLDFDLDLAKSQSADNPVYYIQYGHARICSVLRQAQEKGLVYDQERGLDNLARLTETHETALLTSLSRYGEVIESAAMNEEPHQLTHYLRELANDFHTYYNAHQFLVEQPTLRDARLCLIVATRQLLSNGLRVLGVSAPEEM